MARFASSLASASKIIPLNIYALGGGSGGANEYVNFASTFLYIGYSFTQYQYWQYQGGGGGGGGYTQFLNQPVLKKETITFTVGAGGAAASTAQNTTSQITTYFNPALNPGINNSAPSTPGYANSNAGGGGNSTQNGFTYLGQVGIIQAPQVYTSYSYDGSGNLISYLAQVFYNMSATSGSVGSGVSIPSVGGTLGVGGQPNTNQPGVNTGSGGLPGNPGTAGSSGIIVFSYPSNFPPASTATGSFTTNVSNGIRYYIFTSSGSITF